MTDGTERTGEDWERSGSNDDDRGAKRGGAGGIRGTRPGEDDWEVISEETELEGGEGDESEKGWSVDDV